MNTPEQNKKNVFALKKILTEIFLALSIAWTGCWFMNDSGFYWVALLGSTLIVHMLRYFTVPLKFLYILCTFTFSLAFFVTLFSN